MTKVRLKNARARYSVAIRAKVTGQYVTSFMAKRQVKALGIDEAILLDRDGYVSEASGENLFVAKDGALITAPDEAAILHGITRRAILDLAARDGLKVEERSFTPEEAYEASEAFITSASTFVYPVVKVDERILGNGAPGPVATKLRQLYIEMALAES